MRKFTKVTSHVAPIPIKDVDTDMILPAEFLTRIERTGFGAGLFVRLRKNDPAFFLNEPRFEAAQMLVADSNFGCGSSREHAVWALLDAGIRVIIAPSFADIFSSNSAKNGLLLITLESALVRSLLEKCMKEHLELQVDLATQQVCGAEGECWEFTYDQFRKHCLLEGVDDLGYLRSRQALIEQRKAVQRTEWFYTVGVPNR